MKTETLRVRNVVDATRFLGAWLRAGEGIGWLAAGTMPISLYRMPLVYLFLACVFCYSCSFLFVVFCVFVFFFCSHWSLVDGRCSSDIFSVQQTTYRIGNHVYYWVWLRPDRLMWRKQQQQLSTRCSYIGEPLWYHEEVLSLQPMFPPKPLDTLPLEVDAQKV